MIECCICLTSEKRMDKCNTCSAYFHKKCIIHMIIYSERCDTCPQCRQPLPLCYAPYIINKYASDAVIIDIPNEPRESVCFRVMSFFGFFPLE